MTCRRKPADAFIDPFKEQFHPLLLQGRMIIVKELRVICSAAISGRTCRRFRSRNIWNRQPRQAQTGLKISQLEEFGD